MKLLLLKIYIIKIPSSVFIYWKSLEIAGFGKGKGADVKIYQNVRKLCADSVYIRGKKEIWYILQEYSSSSSRKIVA